MIQLREATEHDIEACGKIVFDAFHTACALYHQYNDIPDLPYAMDFIGGMIRDKSSVYSVVALDTASGETIGFNAMRTADSVMCIGPVAVAPGHFHGGTGRRLMQACMDEAARRGGFCCLTVDAAKEDASALYLTLGFSAVALVTMVGLEVPPSERQALVGKFRRLEDILSGSLSGRIAISQMTRDDLPEIVAVGRQYICPSYDISSAVVEFLDHERLDTCCLVAREQGTAARRLVGFTTGLEDVAGVTLSTDSEDVFMLLVVASISAALRCTSPERFLLLVQSQRYPQLLARLISKESGLSLRVKKHLIQMANDRDHRLGTPLAKAYAMNIEGI